MNFTNGSIVPVSTAAAEGFALSTAALVANILSIVGSLLIIVHVCLAFFTHKANKMNFSRHQQLFLIYAINNVVLAIGGMVYGRLDFKSNTVTCVLQTLHITYFNLTNWFFSVAICVNIVVLIKVDSSLKNVNTSDWKKAKRSMKYMIVYHVVCWGVPLILTSVVAGFWSQFESQGAWCWISKDLPFVRFFCYYFWAIASFIVNLLVTIYITIILIMNFNINKCDFITKLSGRALVYASIFVLCWVCGCIIRIVQVFDRSFYNYPLLLVHTFLSISTAFFVGVAFFFCERVWLLYQEVYIYCKFAVFASGKKPLLPKGGDDANKSLMQHQDAEDDDDDASLVNDATATEK